MQRAVLRSGSWALAIALLAAVIVMAFMIPAARAADYSYVSTTTSSGQTHYSGQKPVINGGIVQAEIGLGTQFITTYYSYPGYYQVAHAAGTPPNKTYISGHASNASSKCSWYISVGGTAPLTCWYRT